MGVGVVRGDGQRGAVAFDSLVQPLGLHEGHAQVVEGVGVPGVKLDRPFVAGDGLVDAAQRLQHVGTVAVGLGVILLDRQRPVYERQRLVVVAGLVGDHAQKVKGRGVIRIHVQNLPVEGFRIPQPARGMVPDRRRQRVAGRIRLVSPSGAGHDLLPSL